MQEAICSSLEDYNKQIELLKEEMNDATRGADNIRNDIGALAQRYAIIERDEECGVNYRSYCVNILYVCSLHLATSYSLKSLVDNRFRSQLTPYFHRVPPLTGLPW